MGGFGSGRSSRRRPTVESSRRIDIRYLRRHGLFKIGTVGSLHWEGRGQSCGGVSFRVEHDKLVLSWQEANIESDRVVEQLAQLETTGCNYGGCRPWFLCSSCGRRCAVLYLAAGSFSCRVCLGLPYQSQLTDGLGRLSLRREKLYDIILSRGRVGVRRSKSMGSVAAELEQVEMQLEWAFSARYGQYL